jgi:hypothetical protein
MKKKKGSAFEQKRPFFFEGLVRTLITPLFSVLFFDFYPSSLPLFLKASPPPPPLCTPWPPPSSTRSPRQNAPKATLPHLTFANSHVKRVCLWGVQCHESGESIFSCVSRNKRRSKYLTSGSTKCGERASTLQLPRSNGKADRNKTDGRNQRTLDCGSSGGRIDQAHVTHHSRTAAYTRHKKRRPERVGFSTQRDNAARASLTCSLSAELEHRGGPRLRLPLQPTPLRGRICPHLEATGSKRQYKLEKDEKVAVKAYM